MNFEFSESVSEAASRMYRQDKQALYIYEESARLGDGHYQIGTGELSDGNDEEVWYLPHHSLVHRQKPDKVRVERR